MLGLCDWLWVYGCLRLATALKNAFALALWMLGFCDWLWFYGCLRLATVLNALLLLLLGGVVAFEPPSQAGPLLPPQGAGACAGGDLAAWMPRLGCRHGWRRILSARVRVAAAFQAFAAFKSF